jgi:hypothetical protein
MNVSATGATMPSPYPRSRATPKSRWRLIEIRDADPPPVDCLTLARLSFLIGVLPHCSQYRPPNRKEVATASSGALHSKEIHRDLQRWSIQPENFKAESPLYKRPVAEAAFIVNYRRPAEAQSLEHALEAWKSASRSRRVAKR